MAIAAEAVITPSLSPTDAWSAAAWSPGRAACAGYHRRRMGSLNPMVWGASIPWYGEPYGEPQSHGMGSLNPMVWGASIPRYGERQSQGMGSLNPKVWNELHHHVTRSFDEWKLTDKDIPAFVSLSLRVQQRALRRHLGGAVDDASGGDRG